jgi:glycosyltransferase involved in cell wall biosynthesis
MRAYLNVSPVEGPWGGGNQWTKSFLAYLAEVGHTLTDRGAHVFVIGSLDGDAKHPSAEDVVKHVRSHAPRSRIVLRVNENDARKGTTHVDLRLRKLSSEVDGVVFVSQWLKDYFKNFGWDCTNNAVIHNGVDKDVFRKRGFGDKMRASRVSKRYHGKVNIVAHHWSDNPLKGADVYESIDGFVGVNPQFTFTYFGRTKSSLANSYVVPPAPADSLGRLLGRYDVYVSGSRHDPGPNHILESLACGLPTYVHKEGGGCVEFAGVSHSFDDWPELERILRSGTYAPNDSFELPTWRECAARYVEFMERTLL